MGTGNSSLSFKTLFRILILLGLILVGTLKSEGNKTIDDESWSGKGKMQQQKQQQQKQRQEEKEQLKNLGKGKSTLVHPQLDLYYISKRRVPNGPDPIHNRRAGNSRRRPGQT